MKKKMRENKREIEIGGRRREEEMRNAEWEIENKRKRKRGENIDKSLRL